MPDVDLIATTNFSYATRRLKAGDRFTVTAPMARVLVGIGKAERPREPGKVAPPPAEVTTRAMTATPPRRDALDHDGDGRKGGSSRGLSSTSAKGAARRRARKSAAKNG